jgi:hypothetical protein
MGGYSHGRGIKSQLANDVRLAGGFYLSVIAGRVSLLKYFPRSGRDGGPQAGTDREDSGVFFILSP